jgi:MFS family permease
MCKVGLILSTAVAAIVVSLPICSFLSEYFGKLRVLSGSLLLFIIATISFGLSETSLWWQITRILQSIGISGISVASTRIALSYSEHLEKNFGYMETITGAVASV